MRGKPGVGKTQLSKVLNRPNVEFGSYLLELLCDYQVTVQAKARTQADYDPIALITSNSTWDIHDAL